MIELAGFMEKSTFIADSKGQVFIGQAWERMWTKFRPNVRLVSLRQIERKAMLFSLVKTRGTRLCSTWQKASYCRSIVKDTCLRGWEYVTFCMTESFFEKGMMETRYDVWVPKKQGR